MSDLVDLVADLIPTPAVSQNVAGWPENEQDFYRTGEWTVFTDRAKQITRIRQVKAAEAILAALGYRVVETPLGEFMKSGGAAKCLTLSIAGWLYGGRP